MNRANPAGRKIKSIASPSHEALTFTNYSRYEERLYVIETGRSDFARRVFGDWSSLVRGLTFHLEFQKWGKFFYATALIHCHAYQIIIRPLYPGNFPGVQFARAQKFRYLWLFSPRSSCVHSFLLHAQYHSVVLMTSPFLFFFPLILPARMIFGMFLSLNCERIFV